MKRIKFAAVLVVIVTIVTAFSACFDGSSSSSSGGAAEKTAVDLSFVAINDLHGHIEQDDDGKNGLANTKRLIDKMSAFYGDNDASTTERDDVVLFANGDMFQGTAISNMSRGGAVVAAMNEMGFDGMGVGNHEFDWGFESVTKYFNDASSEVKANFPLVNSNITQKSAQGLLIGNISDEDNIVSGLIVEKMGVKVGLIGAIGPCENSILKGRLSDYTFEDVSESVKTAALSLKEKGADVISVNIHYGNANDPTNYAANRNIAKLQDENGEWLVDIIFNGHTHTRQKAYIERNDGSFVPIVQGGANNQAVSYVKLSYDKSKDTVSFKDYGYAYVNSEGFNYDYKVQSVINDYRTTLLDSLPVLATAGVTPSRSDYYTYVADIMLSAFQSDYCISNFGGIRSDGNITKNEPIKESNLYEVIPFDNAVYYIEMPGSAIYNHYAQNYEACFYGCNDDSKAIGELKDDSAYYTVSVIDYVYTGAYFDPVRRYVRNETDTHLMLRDLLIEDVTAYGTAGIPWNPALGSRLEKHVW